jgi:hypothetical protein
MRRPLIPSKIIVAMMPAMTAPPIMKRSAKTLRILGQIRRPAGRAIPPGVDAEAAAG